ncbi:reverse transcriptase domain-containing protein [Tanacetum coccineum]
MRTRSQTRNRPQQQVPPNIEPFNLEEPIENQAPPVFINQFFPPSKTTNLRNEITNFQQRFDESFNEAWDLFKDLLRACPHHGFSELHLLDTFYNALNSNDQDSLNSARVGYFFGQMPRDCLCHHRERKSTIVITRNTKRLLQSEYEAASTPGVSPMCSELKGEVEKLASR